jgi:hypothetical protein
MAYDFPEKSKGDDLLHQEWNALTAESKRFTREHPPGQPPPKEAAPWDQFVVQVTRQIKDGDDKPVPGQFWCSRRYYTPPQEYGSSDHGTWTAEAKEWVLDASDLDPGLAVGEKLVAWWHAARKAFIPTTKPPLLFKNASGETVPPRAIMAVIGRGVDDNGEVYVTIAKPSTTLAKLYAINAPFEVVVNDWGRCYDSGIVYAAHNGSATPSVGEKWGAQPGSWYAAKYYPGDLVIVADWSTDNDANVFRARLGSIEPFSIMMKESIAPGESKLAYPVEPSTTTELKDYDGNNWSVTVADTIGDIRARGKDDVAGGDGPGALGIAAVLGDGTVAIEGIQQQAKMIYCQAVIASGNTLDTVDHVSPMDGGQSPVDSASDTLTMTYAGTWETDNDAWGVAAWDETADVWRPIDFPCKTA